MNTLDQSYRVPSAPDAGVSAARLSNESVCFGVGGGGLGEGLEN